MPTIVSRLKSRSIGLPQLRNSYMYNLDKVDRVFVWHVTYLNVYIKIACLESQRTLSVYFHKINLSSYRPKYNISMFFVLLNS